MTLPGLAERIVEQRWDSRRAAFSASKVGRVVAALSGSVTSKVELQTRWLQAVATRVVNARPDLAGDFSVVLGVEAHDVDHLNGLTIGEIGVCYEALLSMMDRVDRKNSGQFFTPDDAAHFMAQRSTAFAPGVWLDPCCGVGNLAWHLAASQDDSASFVRERLVLMDRDEVALKSAVALIAADFAGPGDSDAVRALNAKAVRRDFLSRASLPTHDFTIVNPPYARAEEKQGYETGTCRDLFAYFLERVAKSSRGFIAVTPASYLAAPKFQPLRDVLERNNEGGEVLVFDNVPDTLFRGYKFGSNNTSKTNFVRAAITVCHPEADGWHLTPIIRWQAAERASMFRECSVLLSPRRLGPHGEWAKLCPGLEGVWDTLIREPVTIADMVSSKETEFPLDVGLTPRYYISATYRSLSRGSKATLYFRSSSDRDKAAIVLNSSIPYLWWRALDGGVTLPRRVLMSVPVPSSVEADQSLARLLRASEDANLVVKLNAGRDNENVKHADDLVAALNHVALPGHPDLRLLYASNMFPLAQIGFAE